MNSQSALVAGGGGFVGSHLCESLLEDDYDVFCLDNFGSGRPENLSHLTERDDFKTIEADIREPLDLPPVDEVYHLASRASPKDFQQYPVRIALTNTKGTKNLLDYAVDHDATMLFASTSEVYGDPKVHPQTESYNGNVNIRGPRGCYDESKRFGETLTVAYHNQYDLDVRTVRIFNTYGPRMRADDGRVIPNFLTQAIRGDDLTVYGDGTQTRSFCYVSDLVQGIRQIMKIDEMAGDVVNLGNDREITIKELAKTILEVSKTESGITYEPLPEDDPTRRRPDLSKSDQLFDFDPTVGLEIGLKRTIDYFEDQI
ncbi:UDP-glucuronic acid decarboxylase family protein [Natrinema sp. 74]|uniref:UDP-glucuronic acid decarboxylase family protein n=1 Tax=Natrinema sp. 74 TaxID=3384159 RepID=UPI0038D3898D